MKNIKVRGKRINISITGKGKRTELTFNGEQKDSRGITIPFSELERRNTVVIRRSD